MKKQRASGYVVLTPQWSRHRTSDGTHYLTGVRMDRMTKNRPALDAGEVAVRIILDVPDGLFTEPQLSITLDVPEEAVIRPTEIEATIEVPDV